MNPVPARISRTRRPPDDPARLRALLAVALVAAGAAGCYGAPEPDPELASPGSRIRVLLEEREQPILALATGDTVLLGDVVASFYEGRDYRPAWTDENGFLPRGKALVAALHEATDEGLDVASYHREQVHELIDRARHDVEQGLQVGDLLGNLDLLLTESFVRYTSDLARGVVDPTEVGLDWRIPRGDPTTVAFLNELVETEDFAAALAGLRPDVPFYGRLRDALVRYREIRDRGGWSTVPEGSTLEEGVRDARVEAVRRRLLAEGDPEETRLVADAPDSKLYDARLAEAVEHFQERHGLAADGAVGAGTLAEMNVPVDDRLRALRLNLDRWRWLPRELGDRYILVNVAGFELAVMENHEPALTMNVVVGQEGWHTPIFQDTVEHVVVNPYWGVPPSIAREEVIPAARRDPGYLARNHFEVLDRSGRRVDPRAADLSPERHVIRQLPGSWNALGKVKFLFPNKMNIYLHDTPADHLFSRNERAFSHGCIRLEKPRELARYLFEHAAGRDPDDYDRLERERKESWIGLEEQVPVYILYFTAWVDGEGTVRFYHDVYGRDRQVEPLVEALLPESERSPRGTALAAPPGAAGTHPPTAAGTLR